MLILRALFLLDVYQMEESMMSKEIENEMKNEMMMESRNELRRLLRWIVDHHDDWEHICDSEFFSLTVGETLELIERLEQAGLLSVAYVVLYSVGNKSRQMEIVRDQIIHEIMAELSVERLITIIKNSMKKIAEDEG